MWILELIFPGDKRTTNVPSKPRDEWIIMDNFHKDYEKEFDKDDFNDGEY